MISINFYLFKRDKFIDKKLDSLDRNLKSSFGKIREEFEDHLLAINENTNEIQSTYEYLCEIDQKIEKLAERLDEISMFLNVNKQQSPANNSLLPLTSREREIFVILYTSSDVNPISIKGISRRIGLPEELVARYVNNLVKKGVPILKHAVNNEFCFSIEEGFRRLQAKENIVGLNEQIVRAVR